MQLTIKNTHIFDVRLQEDFREFIKLQKDKLNSSKCYQLQIIYNAILLSNKDESEFYFDNSIYNDLQPKFRAKKDEALDTQLHKCGDVLKEYDIKCYWYSIEGDNLKNNNVKIVLKEDKSKGSYIKDGVTISVIMPNKEHAINIIMESFNKRMSGLYYSLSKDLNNDIMCKILDIKYTEDEQVIYKAFCKEYRDWWFGTEEKEKELKEKLLNRFKMLIELEQKDKEMLDNNDIPKGSINNV